MSDMHVCPGCGLEYAGDVSEYSEACEDCAADILRGGEGTRQVSHVHDYRHVDDMRSARGRWFGLYRCACGAEWRTWL